MHQLTSKFIEETSFNHLILKKIHKIFLFFIPLNLFYPCLGTKNSI